jgi:hypothetical protein
MIMGGLLWYLIRLKRLRRIRQSILDELRDIEAQFLAHKEVSHLQASLSALFRRLAFLKMNELARDVDLPDLLPVLFKILPHREKTLAIVELLSKDRYQKDPKVDGSLLMRLSYEQVKRCRI